jgi:hypothetical protein
MVSPLQPGDPGRRRSHPLGDPFMSLGGVAARLDDRGGDGELVFQRIMGRANFPVLVARVVENEGWLINVTVMPAKAGIRTWPPCRGPGFRLRGNDTRLKNLILNDAPH